MANFHGGATIAQAQVKVEADLRQLNRDMAEAKGLVGEDMKAMGALKARPKIELDLSALERQRKSVQKDIKLLDDLSSHPDVAFDEVALLRFKAKRKELEAELTFLTRNRDVVISMDRRDISLARAELLKMNAALDDGKFKADKWFKSLAKVRLSVGFTSLTIKQFGLALGTLGPIIFHLLGGITALAGSLGEALAGGAVVATAGLTGFALSLGGVISAVKPFLTQLSNAHKALLAQRKAVLLYGAGSDQAKTAQEQLTQAVKNMDPQAKKAFVGIRKLQDAWTDQTSGARKPFFGIITDGIKAAKDLLPLFARNVVSTVKVARTGFQGWFDILKSNESKHALDAILTNFRKALPDVMKGMGFLLQAFLRVEAVASEFLPQFTHGFKEWAKGMADGAANTDKVRATISDLVRQWHSWTGFIGATGHLLTTVLMGGSDAGGHLLDTLTNLFNKWDAFLNTAQGQTEMATFFDQSATAVDRMGGTLTNVLAIMFDLSTVTQPLVQGMLAIADVLSGVASSVTGLETVQRILAMIGATMAAVWVSSKVVLFATVVRDAALALKAFAAGEALATAIANPFAAILGVATGAAAAAYVSTIDLGSGTTQLANAASDAAAAMDRENQSMITLRQTSLDLASSHLAVKEAALGVQTAEANADRVRQQYGKHSLEFQQAQLGVRRSVLTLREAHNRERGAENSAANARIDATAATKDATHKDRGRIRSLSEKRTALKREIRAEISAHGPTDKSVALEKKLKQVTHNLTQARHDLNRTTEDASSIGRIYNRGLGINKSQTEGLLNAERGLIDRLTEGNRHEDKANKLHGVAKVVFGQLKSPLHDVTQGVGQWGTAMKNAGTATQGSMRKSKTAVVTGTGVIDNTLGAQLRKFGAAGPASKTVGRKQQGGEIPHAQMGMLIPGSGSGDKVALTAMVEPGERAFILNRNASSVLGGLQSLNSAVPRRAAGGLAGVQPAESALASRLVSAFGGYVSSGLRAGDTGSLHSQGLAADWVGGDWRGASSYVNRIGPSLMEGIYNPGSHGGSAVSWDSGAQQSPGFWGSATWAQHLTHIHTATGSKTAGAAMPHIKLPLFKAFYAAYQGDANGLNAVSAAAKKYGETKLKKAFATEAGAASAGGGMSQRAIESMWRTVNKNRGNAHLMSAIAMAESGGNPAVTNSIGARGLYQIIPGTAGAFGLNYGRLTDAAYNTLGAGKILSGQGLGAWDTYSNGAYTQYMSGGGQMTNEDKAKKKPEKPHHNWPSWQWEHRMQPKLAHDHAKEARLRERLDIATRHAAFPGSPGGTENTKGERNRQLKLNYSLLDRLRTEKRRIHRMQGALGKDVRNKKLPDSERAVAKKHRHALKGRMTALRGLTGHGGEIFDVQEAIATLKGEAKGEAGDRGLEQTALGTARYDLFSQFGSNYKPIGGLLAGSSMQHTPMAASVSDGPFFGGSMSAGGSGGGHSTTKVVNVTNHYQTQPTDPHTWSRDVKFELRAMG